MEVDTPSAPIYGVNDDVLLCIFTFNGNMFFDSQALRTTRATSQVCRQWRNLMLEAPLLWAKLIDMEIGGNSRKLGWINELIRRSGVAPLWIRANAPFPYLRTASIQEFFFDLVSKNWHRIQKLVVIQDPDFSPLFDATLPMLRLPAPQLETLTMMLANRYTRHKKPPIAPLFATHAPMLRTIRLLGFAIDHKEPWIRQLHTMLLDSAYSIRTALTVLSATNSLQELEINGIICGERATSLPIAALPHLKYLKINGEPTRYYGTLLDHMVIPVGCSFIIRISYPHEHSIMAERMYQVDRICDVFVRHARGRLESHKFNTFHLDCKPRDYLTVKIVAELPVECVLSISIPLHQDLVSMSLYGISRLNLASVTTLHLHTKCSLIPRYFRSFFANLSSVHTIHTDHVSFDYLSSLHSAINATKKPRITLPHLKVIHISTAGATQHGFTVDEEFFVSRLQNGCPITTLDISDGLPFTTPPNLDALEAVKGLKVRYKLPETRGIFEHTCGSGKPANQVDIL